MSSNIKEELFSPNGTDMEILDAVIDLSLYKDRVKEFLKFTFGQQMKALSGVIETNGYVQCLRSQCNYQSTSANGMLIHLCRCVQFKHIEYNSYKFQNRIEDFLDLEKQQQLDCIDNQPNIVKNCLTEQCRFHSKSAVAMHNHLLWCKARENCMDPSMDSTQRAIAAAFSFYENYRNRHKDWICIDTEKRRKVIDFLCNKDVALSCLNCGELIQAEDVFLHLTTCGTPVKQEISSNKHKSADSKQVPPKKRIIKEKETRRPYNAQKSVIVDETYEDYKGRIEDWQQLEMIYQRKLIRLALEASKNGEILCLNPECPVCVTSGPGMLYHSQRCALPKHKYPSKCKICHMKMTVGELEAHHELKHPGSVLQKKLKVTKDTDIPIPLPKRKSAARAETLIEKAVKHEVEESVQNGKDAAESMDVDVESDESVSEDDEDDSQTPGTKATVKKAFRSSSNKPQFTVDRFINAPLRHKIMLKAKNCRHKFAIQNFTKKGQTLFPDWLCDWKVLDFIPKVLESPYMPEFKQSIKMDFMSSSNPKYLNVFESGRLREGCVLFCGGPVSCLKWCPTPQSPTQYFALSTFSDPNLMSVRKEEDMIQIWKVTGTEKPSQCECVLLIAHEFGTALDMAWCPSGGFNPDISRLGLLCVAFANGFVAVFSVPIPESTTNHHLTVRLLPVIKLQIDESAPLPVITVDWSPFHNHNQILVTTTGNVSVINLNPFKHEIILKANEVRSAKWLTQKIVVITYDRLLGATELFKIGKGSFIVGKAKCYSTGGMCYTRPEIWPTFLGLPTKSGIENYTQNLYLPCVFSYDDEELRHTQLGAALARKPTGASISAWTGQIAIVDEGGNIVVALNKHMFLHKLNKRGYGLGCVKLQTILCLSSENSSLDSKVYTSYEDCVKDSTLILRPPDNNLPPSAVAELRLEEYSMAFPITALFQVDWNPNEEYCNWLAAGGQAGIVFLMHVPP